MRHRRGKIHLRHPDKSICRFARGARRFGRIDVSDRGEVGTGSVSCAPPPVHADDSDLSGLKGPMRKEKPGQEAAALPDKRHTAASIGGFHAIRRISMLLLPWAARMISLPVRRCLALLLTIIFAISAGMLLAAPDRGDSAGVFASLTQQLPVDQTLSCPDDDGACGSAMNHGAAPSDCSAMSCAALWPAQNQVSAARNMRRLTFRLAQNSIHGAGHSRMDRPPRLT